MSGKINHKILRLRKGATWGAMNDEKRRFRQEFIAGARRKKSSAGGLAMEYAVALSYFKHRINEKSVALRKMEQGVNERAERVEQLAPDVYSRDYGKRLNYLNETEKLLADSVRLARLQLEIGNDRCAIQENRMAVEFTRLNNQGKKPSEKLLDLLHEFETMPL